MTPSSSDDPFADLFGNLPDPHAHALRSGREDAGYGPAAGGDGGAAANTGGPPLSRREARAAAAARRSTTEPSADDLVPTPTPAADASSLDASGMLSQPRTYAGAPSPVPVESKDDDTWLLADGTEPALPYSRTGSTPTMAAGAPAADVAPTGRVAPTATLEDLFTGSRSTDELGAVPPPKNKRRRRIGGWIALGVILAILGGAAAGGWYVWTTYEDKIREVMGWEEPQDFEAGLANGEVFVTIANGDTGAPISRSLHEAGVTKTPDVFYDYLIDNGENPPFVPGVFKLQKQMTSEAALAALLDPANKIENAAQLREGLTVEQSLDRLAEGTGIPLEDFQAAVADPSAYGVSADSLEGWLFPATYTFDPGTTAEQVVQTLVNRTVQSLDDAGVPVDDRQRILTIASIIEREARSADDMQKVSRVILNRLDPANQETFGLLQMDSTAQFGYGEMHDGSASTSEEAQFDDNPWNTYVHPGLPVGPIANPGDVAIYSAMHPADGDWFYFVTVNLDTGETVFTSNLADHNRAREQWIDWCRDNPDSGC